MNSFSTVILLMLLFGLQYGKIIVVSCLDHITVDNDEQHSIHKRSIDHDFGILPDVYYQNIAPMQNGQPVQVKVSVIILNLKIGSISTQVNFLDLNQNQTVLDSIN